MVASIGNSKAMIGVIFLQYCSYALFYLLDELNEWAPPLHFPLIQHQRDEQERRDKGIKDPPKAAS